jgi:hypothetical protein
MKYGFINGMPWTETCYPPSLLSWKSLTRAVS